MIFTFIAAAGKFDDSLTDKTCHRATIETFGTQEQNVYPNYDILVSF